MFLIPIPHVPVVKSVRWLVALLLAVTLTIFVLAEAK